MKAEVKIPIEELVPGDLFSWRKGKEQKVFLWAWLEAPPSRRTVVLYLLNGEVECRHVPGYWEVWKI